MLIFMIFNFIFCMDIGDYRIDKTIGEGTFGKVRLGVNK